MSRRGLATGVLLCLVLTSCGGSAPPSGQATSRTPVADTPELSTPAYSSSRVTYQDRAVVFDRATWKRDLKSISDDQTTYTFDGGSPQAKQLQAGKTLFLYGRAFRRVTGVQAQGGQLVVSTDNAALTDLIKDGSLKWKQAPDFSKGAFITGNSSLIGSPGGRIHTSDSPSPASSPADSTPSADPGSPSPEPATPSPDGTPVAMSGPGRDMVLTAPDGSQRTAGYRLAGADPGSITVDGYKLAVSYTPAPDRVSVKLTASKDFGAGTVSLTGSGFIKKFTQTADIEIRSGSLDSYTQHQDGVDAEMTISWLSRKEGSGTMSETTILKPSISYNAPFVVAGIPMFTEIAVNAAAIPAFSTQGSARASFKISYSGDHGIDFKQGKVAGGDHHSGTFSIENSSLVSTSIISMTAEIAFPKITIGFGWRQPGLSFSGSVAGAAQGVSAAGWTDLLITMSSITTGLVNAGTGTSCVKTQFAVTGRVGMEFKIFGIDLPNPGAQEIWIKKVHTVVPPGSPLCEKLAMPGD